MHVLGIETSCDETSCAVVRRRRVLSNCTVSSLKFHKKYGGVVPEIATRNHCAAIDSVTRLALRKARCALSDIDVFAVTSRPGLIGALLVGLNFAKGLSVALRKPYLAVNHLYAHLFAPFLNTGVRFPFPFMGLVVSGGHTDFFLVKDFDAVKLVGSSRDDAAGEAFDKVGRAFGVGYPGGVYIDKLYRKEYKDAYAFKCGKIGFDLSFSGIKTALIYKKKEIEEKGGFDYKTKVALLSSFQETIARTVAETAVAAAAHFHVSDIVCGGGVSANSRLRQLLVRRSTESGMRLFLSPGAYTSDNAAMVAGLGFYLYNKNRAVSPLVLSPQTY